MISGANDTFYSCGSLVVGPNVDTSGTALFKAPNGVELVPPVSMQTPCEVMIDN